MKNHLIERGVHLSGQQSAQFFSRFESQATGHIPLRVQSISKVSRPSLVSTTARVTAVVVLPTHFLIENSKFHPSTPE